MFSTSSSLARRTITSPAIGIPNLRSMRVPLVGVGGLDGLRRRSWVLGLTDGVLPVIGGVPVEDHVAVLLAGGAALLNDVPKGGRSLEEPELRLEVLLAVHLWIYWPEGVGAVHEHLGWQGVYAVLPDLELPVVWGPEGKVHPQVPVRGVVAEDSCRHAEHGHALVVPGPPYVREVALEPRRLAHGLEVGRPTVGALAPVVEDARVKDRVHAQIREGSPQPHERRVVRVPVGRHQLTRAPQTQLVVAALRLLDHEVHRAAEVAAREGGHRIQGAEAEEPLRGPAADVGAVVVVRADVLQVVGGDLVCPDVEHRGEEEDLLDPAEVHALEDLLGALLTGQVGVAVQDPVHVVDDVLRITVPTVLAHGTILSSSLARRRGALKKGRVRGARHLRHYAEPSFGLLDLFRFAHRCSPIVLSLPSSHIALTLNNDGVATPILLAPVFPRSAVLSQARYYRGAVPVSGRVRWNVTPVCDREGTFLYASAQWGMIHVCTATYTKMVRTFRPGCVRVCAFSGARDGAEPAQGHLSYDVRSRLRARFGE